MAREIQLTRGFVAIVDDEDYERVAANKWRSDVRRSGAVYAVRAIREGRGANARRICVPMHRFIIGAPPDKHVDHINGNGLDNRKQNLRLCTPAENARNRKPSVRKYKGVERIKRDELRRPFCVRIGVNGKNRVVGYFDNEIDAARAYDRAARELYGEFARTNFPTDA